MHSTKTIALLSGSVLAGSALAQQRAGDDLVVQRSGTTGLARFVTAPGGGPVDLGGLVDPADFLVAHGDLFGITNAVQQLVTARVTTDQLEFTHTRYTQQHQGIKVFSGVVVVHQNAAGQVYAANGDFFPIPPALDTTPAVTEADAGAIAINEMQAVDPAVVETELVIVNPAWYGDSDIGVRLAHHLVVSDLATGTAEAFFVDAHQGEVIDRWPMTHTARERSIHDAGNTGALPGSLARFEGDAPTGDIEVDALYDYLGDTYDYFFRGFGRDGLDGAGLTILGTASYSPGNFCPNASWSSDRLAMQFCEETTTDDVVAHEYTHGLTQFTADLIYQNQSGQLNESFSDVFGELVDLFNGNVAFPGSPSGAFWPPHPTGPGNDFDNELRTTCSSAPDYLDGTRWLVGEDATAFGGSIRDMWNPVCENDPDFANSPLQTCSLGDSGGVHSGSGVPNHAFAILTDGKVFNGFTVNGIGPIKAGAVWFRALSEYLTVASDFEDAYLALNQAAADLVGTFPNDPRTGNPSVDMFTAADADEVDKALRAVEMDTPGACGVSSIVLRSDAISPCDSRTTLFSDDFESGAPGWTVFNTAPPTPYDWVLTSGPLPFDRAGTAWFCDAANFGICGQDNESAVHSLVSPVIDVPATAEAVAASFTHYLASEGFFDGGVVSVSVNGGEWETLPRSAFEFNPYNSILAPPEFGNPNPLAGLEAWTGAGGAWGTSVVDLSGFAAAGDQLQLRFDFGRNDCTGLVGWYVDDVEVYSCPDCNGDGTSDHRDFNYSAAPSIIQLIGANFPATTTLIAPPPAGDEVILDFGALADLSSDNEFLEVEINGVPVGLVYETAASDCATTPDFARLLVSADDYNAAVGDGDATITITGSSTVDPFACFGLSALNITVQYAVGGNDVNDNGIPDGCECIGDVTGDGVTNVSDLIAVISAWGTADPSADVDGSGTVDVNDLVAVIDGWGVCP